MCNYSGIIFRMLVDGSIWLILGLICIAIDRHSPKKKISFHSWILIVLAICTYCYFGSIAINPSVETHEGYLAREYRDGGFGAMAYVFTASGDNRTFYLDFHSKKQIHPDKLSTDTKYRIYYEAQTRIIVGIEICT